jgi:antitoxin (DNA-binding transcriptional repressor) of toxin-antitoxin stability system
VRNIAEPIEIEAASIRLAELIDRAAAGEEIVISRAGRPVARLVACGFPQGGRRALGVLAGKAWIADDFDDPLPDDVLADFEGRD